MPLTATRAPKCLVSHRIVHLEPALLHRLTSGPWRRFDTTGSPHAGPLPKGKGELAGNARLVIEQPLLGRKATRKPGQGAVGADDAMAGQHDADRVRTIRGAHRSGGRRSTERPGLLAVAGGRAERDVGERAPCGKLKAGSFQIKWELETFACAGKVLIEVGRSLSKNGMVGVAQGSRGDPGVLRRFFRPEDCAKAAVGRDQRELADGRGVRRAVERSRARHGRPPQ